MEGFKTYCCGLNQKHAIIIIGVVQSILSFMSMILCSAYAEHPHELVDMADLSIVPNLSVLKSILITIAVAAALQCVFSILLIFGAETNRPVLLLPWLAFLPIIMGSYMLLTLVAIFHHNTINNTPFIVGHLILSVTACVIGLCKFFAVKSYYKHLKSLNF